MSTFIHDLRTKHRYSQEDIAKLIGISRQTFALIEKGETELTITQIKKLVDLFGYDSVDAFLAEKEISEPKQVSSSLSEVMQSQKIETVQKQTLTSEKKLNKAREILLYILAKIGAKPNVGESVIYQLLYFIDFDYFERYEEQIMGIEYIKNHHGPFPTIFFELIADMQKNNELVYVDKKYFQFQQKKYLPLRNPNLELLTAKEIEHINWVLARLSDKNAKEIEEYSQRDVPWITAAYHSPIDYKAVFYRSPEFSVKECKNV